MIGKGSNRHGSNMQGEQYAAEMIGSGSDRQQKQRLAGGVIGWER